MDHRLIIQRSVSIDRRIEMKSIVLLLLLLSNLVYAQENIAPVLKGEYLGQNPPGLVPEVFALELIS